MKQKNWMLLILAGALFIFGACSFQAQAQDYVYATGNPNFGVDYPIPGGFINITNGNVHITIPLGSFKQLGSLPPVKINLEYDSRIWKINDNNGNYSWQPNNVPNSMAGWRLTTGLEGSSSSFEMITQPYPSEYTNGCPIPSSAQYNDYFNLITRFTWTDPQGTKHPFDVETEGPGFQCKYVANNYPYVSSTSGYAIDNSGYYLEVTNYTDMTVYDSAGNQVYTATTSYASAQTYNNSSGNTSQIKDPSGNIITGVDTDSPTVANEDASASNPYGEGVDTDGSVVDSMGRTIFTTTTSTTAQSYCSIPTSANTITYGVLKEGGGINPTNPFTVTTMPISFNTNFGESDVSEFNGNDCSMPVTIQSIRLPDGSSYSFTYDSGNYGELTSMTLPTGGVVSFTYMNYFDSYNNFNRWISSVTDSYGTANFTPSVLSYCSSGGVGCQEQVALSRPSGDSKVYTLTLNNGAWDAATTTYVGSVNPYYSAELMTVINNYSFNSNPCWNPYVCTGAQNITASSSTVTLDDTGQTAQTVYSYIYGRLLSSSQEYDYGASSPTRETDYTYTWGVNGSSLLSQTTKIANGKPFAQIGYGYDYTNNNMTSKTEYVPGSSPLVPIATTSYTYDNHGRTSKTDPKGNTTSYSDPYVNVTTFTSACNSISPLQTTTTYPQINGIIHATTVTSDCSSGDPLNTTDENGQVTTYGYDNLGRKNLVKYPDNGQTSYSYPSPTQVVESKLIYGSTYSTVTTTFDKYGQKSNVAQSDPADPTGGDTVTYTYDADGRLQCKSNPSRSSSAPTDGKTCYTYDALDRVTLVIQPDGQPIQVAYSGNQATVTDENWNEKIYTYDAFHDLTSVLEPSASTSGAFWTTNYTYDGAGRVTEINQAGDGSSAARVRYFNYDSLGRMINEQTPEAGTKSYTYDLNGNLTSSTNGSNTISYNYDTLNRMTSKTSSDGTINYTYTYDALSGFTNSGSNTIGRLVEEYNNVNAGSFFMYDPMGRIVYQANCIPSDFGCSPSANIEKATYDLVGDMTSFTYPDGRVVTQTFDSAQHLTGIQYASMNGQVFNTSYYSATAFAPTGETTNATFGNGVQMAASFNSRQSITALSYGIPNQTPLWSKQYTWAPNAKDLLQIVDASTISQPQTYNYAYDPDNRLTSASGGSLTVSTPATPGTGSVTISGGVSRHNNGSVGSPDYIYDCGYITIQVGSAPQVGSASYSVYYSEGSTASGLASSLATAINGDPSSLVTASVSSGTITLTSKATGAYSNYLLSLSIVSSDPAEFPNGSFKTSSSESLLTRGTAAQYTGTYALSETYSIDPWGNQQQTGNFNFVQPYTATNQISASGYIYDPAGTGELTSDGIGNTYTYDAEGMLTGSNGAQYTYDALQQRVAKVGGSHAGEVVYFGGRPVALYNPASGAWTDMIWAGGNLLGEVTGSQAPEYRLLDHEGSLVATTDSSGNVTGTDLLTPYGQAVSNSTSDFYLYTGLDQDAINGSDHAWYRNYSTAQSRWLRPDPYNGSYDLYNPQSFNRYNYVENNPLEFTDPSGLANGWATGVGGSVCKNTTGSVPTPIGSINPCDPAASLIAIGINSAIGTIGFSSISGLSSYVAAAITIACSIDNFNNAACGGSSGWASIAFGNGSVASKVVGDTTAVIGAVLCAAGGPTSPGCIGYAMYTIENFEFSFFWGLWGPPQFTGSLLPRPADLSGLGTSSIGIPNRNLNIQDIIGQPSHGTILSPGMNLP